MAFSEFAQEDGWDDGWVEGIEAGEAFEDWLLYGAELEENG